MTTTPPATPKRGKASKQTLTPAEAKTLRRRRLTIWIPVLLVLALVGGYVGSLAISFMNAAGEVTEIVDPFPEESERPSPPADPEVQTILLMGSDTRGKISKQLENVKGTRSDMMMLVRVDPKQNAIDVMSIMRDTWVPIPGFGQNKINAALSFGGVKLAVQTVEQLLDTRIDHVAMIDMKGLSNLTDALGGITIDNPKEFKSRNQGGFTFERGLIDLDGEQVQAFVRERYAFSDGDYTRVTNQRIVLKALLMKAFSREVVTDPARLISTFGSLSPYLATDAGLNAQYAITQAGFLVNFEPENINLFTMPNAGTGSAGGGQSVVFLDKAALKQLKADWEAGTLASY